MTFTTHAGTYGAHEPGRFMKMMSRMPNRRVRSGGRAAGGDALVLTTVGAKTGHPHSNPVARFPGGSDGSWIVVAAASGAAHNPGWYYNLAAHPDEATIEFNGEKIPVSAHELHGAERDEAWATVTTIAPRFGGYVSKTDRVLPVIRLTRRT
jgi:deazaflavin-dependent oxidoreductase (nitroreductase family)